MVVKENKIINNKKYTHFPNFICAQEELLLHTHTHVWPQTTEPN